MSDQHVKPNAKSGPRIEAGWMRALKDEFKAPYFQQLKSFIFHEKSVHNVFPKGNDVFRAFDSTPFKAVKVVILGQDPYHGPGQAHGLSFSVPDGIPFPPSLRNILKELTVDLGTEAPKSGNLASWASQGVLLLNATLTVRAHEAGSHQKQGWEQFTDQAIQALNRDHEGLVFLLWGRFAQQKEALIDTEKHYVLKAPHPSPLSASRGFFGCRHFSKTNRILQAQGKAPIDWQLA